jgi:hypothetical protein
MVQIVHPKEVAAQAYLLDEFLAAFRMSRRTWYNMVERGTAPRFYRDGTRIKISIHAAMEWQAAREAATSNTGHDTAHAA